MPTAKSKPQKVIKSAHFPKDIAPIASNSSCLFGVSVGWPLSENDEKTGNYPLTYSLKLLARTKNITHVIFYVNDLPQQFNDLMPESKIDTPGYMVTDDMPEVIDAANALKRGDDWIKKYITEGAGLIQSTLGKAYIVLRASEVANFELEGKKPFEEALSFVRACLETERTDHPDGDRPVMQAIVETAKVFVASHYSIPGTKPLVAREIKLPEESLALKLSTEYIIHEIAALRTISYLASLRKNHLALPVFIKPIVYTQKFPSAFAVAQKKFYPEMFDEFLQIKFKKGHLENAKQRVNGTKNGLISSERSPSAPVSASKNSNSIFFVGSPAPNEGRGAKSPFRPSSWPAALLSQEEVQAMMTAFFVAARKSGRTPEEMGTDAATIFVALQAKSKKPFLREGREETIDSASAVVPQN